MILLYNFVFVLLSFVLFSLGGWSLIAPFGRQLPFPSARAALAGLAAVPCATLSIHVVLELAYWKAAIIACFVLIGGSLVSVSIYGARDVFRRIDTVVILTVMLAGTAAFTTTRTDFILGEPALLYFLGSDHLGYAHIADWIRMRGNQPPFTPNPSEIYENWPIFLF